MVQYATAEDLATHLETEVDEAAADQALSLASAEFSSTADTWFLPVTETYVTTGTRAQGIWLPYSQVTAVDEVRINGATVGGWFRINNRLFRSAGFGSYSASVPDILEVDLTYGYATVPDDVRLAVLEMAALTYDNPTGAMTESIDDYTVRYDTTGKAHDRRSWRDVAMRYRGSFMA